MSDILPMLFQMPNIIFVVGGVVALVALVARYNRKLWMAGRRKAAYS